MTKATLTAVAGALLLGGCSLIPDYLRPDLPVAPLWPEGEAYEAAAVPAQADSRLMGDLAWEEFFRAPALRALIRQALDNNRDLRVAASTIERARAQYRVQEADLFPEVDVGAGLTRQRQPGTVTTSGKSAIESRYSVDLATTAYELDLFGRLRSLEQQALERYLATAEARDATQIALVAEVANAYLTLLADRKLLALSEETLATQQKAYELIQRRFERGLGSQLDVSQARTSVETARASRARYLRQVAQDKNALTLLVGAPIDEAALAADQNLGMEDFLADVPAGLPSDVLLRRPDVRQAEFELKAANANIGAARAAFYPTITLTASAGTASRDLSDLFAAGSGAWAFIPRVTLPIFDAGRNQANLDAATAGRDIAVAQYERAIQAAFREVADALAARGTLGAQLEAQKALVSAYQQSYQLSEARYSRGIDNYLNVLDAQRSLFAVQQEQIAVELARLTNLVTLYKALGGGRF